MSESSQDSDSSSDSSQVSVCDSDSSQDSDSSSDSSQVSVIDSDSSQDSDGTSDSGLSSGSEDSDSEKTGDGRLKLWKYEMELTENELLEKNTIIYDGPGSGETHEDVFLTRHLLDGAPEDEVEQTRKVARERDFTSLQYQNSISDKSKSPAQANRRKRKRDSSRDKELKGNTILKQNGNSVGDDRKRMKTITKKRKNDKMNEDAESFTPSLSRAGSSGCLFQKEQDDTLSESMVNKYSEQMKLVGALIAFGHIVGTVFRVGSRYVMTADHVVRNIVDDNGQITDDSVYICFNESLLDRQRTAFLLNKEVFRNKDLDVSVLEISANSETPLPPGMKLSKEDAVLTLRLEDISLIGYGHQTLDVKHLDPRCKLISPSSQRLKDAHEWLEQNATYFQNALRAIGRCPDIVSKGYADYNDSSKLLFDSYMQQGASGSPALTNNNSQPVKVVGILTHGLPEFYFLLPRVVQLNVQNKYRFEVGSKMSSIYQAIMESDQNLAEDLFG